MNTGTLIVFPVLPGNRPPVLTQNLAELNAIVGSPVTLTVNATDPDGDSIEFSIQTSILENYTFGRLHQGLG